MTKLLCLIGLHGWAYSGLWFRECWRCQRTQRKGASGAAGSTGWQNTLERDPLIGRSRRLRAELDQL